MKPVKLTAEELTLYKSMASEDLQVAAAARTAFAATVAEPLGKMIAAESTIRSIFEVDPLEPGQIASYPKKHSSFEAVVLPGLAEVPRNILFGDELLVPTFDIVGSAEWPISYARDGRYNVASEALGDLKDAIVRQERYQGWKVIKACITEGNANTVDPSETTFSKKFVNALLKEFNSREGYTADLLVVSPTDAADVREWAGDNLDDETQREIWKNAGIGNIWGVDIMQDFELVSGESYLFDTSKFGKMPIRAEFQTHDDPTAIRFLRIGLIGFENVGFASCDPLAVYKGELSDE